MDNNCFYYLITSDYEFLKYSPGRILLKKQINWCIKNDIKKIDLGPGEFEYKKQLSFNFDENFIIEAKSFGFLLFLYKLKKILFIN